MPSAAAEGSHAINFAWLIRLRWAAIVAQAVTVALVHVVMGVPLELLPLGILIGAAAVSNLGCQIWARRRPSVCEWHLGTVLVVDILVLSGLLYFSGGPFNPFSFLYLVQIVLAAVVLRPSWTWALVALSLACSAFLFLDHHELVLPARTHDEHMRWHLEGMWVAFGVAATFIVYFLMRILAALRTRERELDSARTHAERQDRLASLATLAGGAAHELATPLSTIATVVRELELALADASPGVRDDLAILRGEVARCRRILDQMSVRSGESVGEAAQATTLAAVVARATAELPAEPKLALALPDGLAELELHVPGAALAQALRALIANAQDAAPAGSTVEIAARRIGDRVRVEVHDHGVGIAADVLARIGEPFYTTKTPGRGMGLGVFLARAVAERLGGGLELASHAGTGTTASLSLPVAASNDRIAAAPGEPPR